MTTALGTRGRRAASRRRSRGPELAVAALLLVTALVLALNADAVIAIEAKVTAFAMGLFTFGESSSWHHLIYVGIGTTEVLGFQITPLCTSLVLATPVLVVAGVLLLFPRARLPWVLKGVAIGLSLAVGANLARFVLVGVALQLWGRNGFEITHHYVGSVLVLLCSAVALMLLLVVAMTGRLSTIGRWLRRIGAPRA